MGLGNLLLIPGLGVVAPTITDQPDSIEVYESQTATFTVTATGTGLSYQWQKSDNAGVDWSNISGATSSSYTTAATVRTTDNDDQFRCVVTNSAGTVNSNAATLTVWNPLALGADLACWLDPSSGIFTERTGASATTAATNGDPVGTWRARNGTINGIAGTDAQRGIYRATGVNGTPGLEFDGTDDLLDFTTDLAAIFRNKAFGYIFAAVRCKAKTTQMLPIIVNGGTGNGRALIVANRGGISRDLGAGGRRLDADSFAVANLALAYTDLEAFVVGGEFLWSTSDCHLRKNNARIASNTSFQTNGNTSDTASSSVLVGSAHQGFLGHVVLTCPSAAHDTTTLGKIEGFINYKSGSIY